MDKKESFSDSIRRAIEESGMSRYQIAQETGIAESNLSRFVRGMAEMKTESLDRLAECLGLRVIVEKKPRKTRR